MGRMFAWTGAGAVAGFIFGVIGALLLDRSLLNPAPLAILTTIATPIGAVVGAIFGAVFVVQGELDEMRREIMRWQRIEELNTVQDRPSTQIKSAPSERS